MTFFGIVGLRNKVLIRGHKFLDIFSSIHFHENGTEMFQSVILGSNNRNGGNSH
jgi:hypothetical protein